MKIGILTLPSSFNYGGILQAYALQHTLDKLGYDNVIIRRERPKITNENTITRCKNLIKKIIGNDIYTIPDENQKAYIERNCRSFIESNLRKTEQVSYDTNQLSKLCRENSIDTIIVGSDQVWRPRMTADIRNYFLDFCGKETVKIAYAASFGVDEWEYSSEETGDCSKLAKEFKLVTVREDSGLKLCEEKLGVMAQHVLDPTMLLSQEDYIHLTQKCDVNKSNGSLFYYLLNENKAKSNLVKRLSEYYALKPFTVMPKFDACLNHNADNFIDECVFASPATWIRAFIDAEYVVTDSFHGTVFSIIFNKPFWVIGNKTRGNARFSSLLKLYNLENRYISDVSNVHFFDLDKQPTIDWNMVNKIRQEKKEYSLQILRDALRK